MIQVMVDLLWPHPIAKDDAQIEHKCHKREMIDIPNLLTLYDNNQLRKFINDKYVNYETGESLVAKISCLYEENLFPTKIIVLLRSPLRIEPPDFKEVDVIVEETKEPVK